MAKYRYVIAIDPSLTCSGWALFRVIDEKLLAIGKLRSLPATTNLSIRLSDLQSRIRAVLKNFKLGRSDILVCEGETTMKDPRAAIRVERVRGIFETVARDFNVTVPGRINPRTVQSELMGIKGRQPKREIVKGHAVQIVATLFKAALNELGFDCDPDNLKRNQDIVDALLIGTLALSRIRSCRDGITVEEIFTTTRQRKRSRKDWGSGGDNSLGWSDGELKRFLVKSA